MNYSEVFVKLFQPIAEQESHHKGFGVNTDILDTNIINLAILLYLLVYVGRQAISSLLSNRQQKVLTSIQEAEERLQQADQRLNEAQKQLSQTKVVIDQIHKEAENTAQQVRESTFAQGKVDIERLVASGKASIANAETQVKKKLQKQVASSALGRVSDQLREEMTKESQLKIIDDNIAQLGGK